MADQMQAEAAQSTGAQASSTTSPACIYCGCGELAPLFTGVRDRLRYVPGTWQFVKCADCGSALLWPPPDPADLPSFYPPVYSFHPDLERRNPVKRLLNWLEYKLFFLPQYRTQARSVSSKIRLAEGKVPQLLDIGCGRGLRLLAFQSKGFQCFGADFQDEVVVDVRQRLGVPAVCCDVECLAEHFPPESFDVITAFFLLEHVLDVMEVLRISRKLLRPGGWFVGAVPFLDTAQCAVLGRHWINVSEAPRHLSLPTRKGMRLVCERAEYDRVSIRPDSCLNCAGQLASSLLPDASITQAYAAHSRLWPLLLRVLGAGITVLAIPFVLVENHLLRRPATGLVFARKPPSGQRPG